MQVILKQDILDAAFERADSLKRSPLGKKIGVFGKLFGCWHKDLSRPMTRGNLSYRACLECGARRRFDTESFKTMGPFHYPPMVSPDSVRNVT